MVISSLNYLKADSRPPNANPVTGDGDFSRRSLGVYGEYGLTDTVTLGGAARLEDVRFHGSDQSGRSVGVSDLEVFVRPVIWRGDASMVAVQGGVIIPGGYERNHNPALGDGAVGSEFRLLYGRGVVLGPWPGFFDVEGAYRFRSGAPADQLRIDATLGAHPADGWLLQLQSRNTISAGNQTGPSLGPGLAGRYGTDYDLYSLVFSVVRDVSPRWSIELGVVDEIGGRNYSTGEGAFLSLWRKF